MVSPRAVASCDSCWNLISRILRRSDEIKLVGSTSIGHGMSASHNRANRIEIALRIHDDGLARRDCAALERIDLVNRARPAKDVRVRHYQFVAELFVYLVFHHNLIGIV